MFKHVGNFFVIFLAIFAFSGFLFVSVMDYLNKPYKEISKIDYKFITELYKKDEVKNDKDMMDLLSKSLKDDIITCNEFKEITVMFGNEDKFKLKSLIRGHNGDFEVIDEKP